MGVKIGPLIKEAEIGREVDPAHFEGKVIAIDALPTIYEMLATIRDPRGGYLRDSKGRVTSHLVGIFNRTCRMLALGIRPVYVFDGPPHPLKMTTIEERRERRELAQKKYEEALSAGRIDEAVKFAKQAMIVTDELIASAKTLISLLGVPIITAPHDGEAQAAYLVKKGEAYAVSSPDYDSFLYGSPRVVRNLKMTLQKKERPILYELNELLEKLGITHQQLVDVAILIGTDYNPDGIEGIGPKKALELIRKYGSLENLIKQRKIVWRYEPSPEEIKAIFLNPPVTDNYRIEFREPDREKILEFLVEEHDFSRERVEKELEDVFKRLEREKKAGVQASLDMFFG
ncbi:MAG: flap endonuclease-1 [Candidatus Njordarchaeales archaeon]